MANFGRLCLSMTALPNLQHGTIHTTASVHFLNRPNLSSILLYLQKSQSLIMVDARTLSGRVKTGHCIQGLPSAKHLLAHGIPNTVICNDNKGRVRGKCLVAGILYTALAQYPRISFLSQWPSRNRTFVHLPSNVSSNCLYRLKAESNDFT